jgi:hypothetical protein
MRESKLNPARLNYDCNGDPHRRTDRIGKDLAIYLNGELVLEREFEGSAYDTSNIGLGAGGGSLGFSEVRFDNPVVVLPQAYLIKNIRPQSMMKRDR